MCLSFCKPLVEQILLQWLLNTSVIEEVSAESFSICNHWAHKNEQSLRQKWPSSELVFVESVTTNAK